MNTADLDRLEQQLGVVLPTRYRKTMLAYPFPPDHDAAVYYMIDDADAIIDQNGARPAPPDEVWPPEFVVIGSDGSELNYILDGRTEAAPVLEYDLETGKLKVQAENFDVWLQQLRDWQHQREEDEKADLQRARDAYANRRWWQFWIGQPPEG